MRIDGWEERLADYIEQRSREDFVWGENDCAIWCGKWIRLITGKDHASEWEGQYSTEEEAYALVSSKGYSAVSDIPDAHLTSCPVMFARRGDILLHPCGTLGICAGLYGIFPTEKGVLKEKTMDCVRAWRVE